MIEPQAVAVVGLGAILPDALDVSSFWGNILSTHYSITDVTPDRWNPDLYFNSDPSKPDMTYSKIGGWVRGFQFEPLKWGIPIPPNIVLTMDQVQQWAIAACRQALLDYGYPKRSYDPNRVAVILGNSIGGENIFQSTLRIHLPDYQNALESTPAFQQLPLNVQQALLAGMASGIHAKIPMITEDTLPGELSNVIAGRVANAFNFGGPNFTTDAACASSLAAVQAAVEGLISRRFDLVLTGGADRSMGVESFVKFSKIGALSPDGSRPYSSGANGFVMGEGAAVFMLKRLAEAEHDGDKIYAVIRGIGSSSDGKGKGITAPNPAGQQRAIQRAWENAGVSPASAGLIEGHGTSTRVGDLVEVNSLASIFASLDLPAGKIALGSVKSNFGHLKSAAGAAGMLKTILALSEKILPPSLNFTQANPEIDFKHLPFYVNTEPRAWTQSKGEIRRAAVSSFGFGGTNFHMVLEEHVPGYLTSDTKVFPKAELKSSALSALAFSSRSDAVASPEAIDLSAYGGLLFLCEDNSSALEHRLFQVVEQTRLGILTPTRMPTQEELGKMERLAIEYSSTEELIKRAEKALKAFTVGPQASWQALTAQGVYRGSGKPGKVAFLFPGQGSQYVNMLRELCAFEPVVKDTYREADEVMTPILGKPLTSFIFVEGDEASLAKGEADLRNTTITQPAVLTANVALLRLMNKFGFTPDIVTGHSLGEYAALVASGVLSFPDALQVVSARGREMAKVSYADNGCMAAISAPLVETERILAGVGGYVVIANINSPVQSVIGGATLAVEAALAAFQAAGFQAVKIPVSLAFHTQIVAPASGPLRQVIARMDIRPPQIPVVANVTGELYPSGRDAILDLLAAQVASPVQFVKGMTTLYGFGARIFVEVGPKRVLNALATDNLKDKTDVVILATNHPRKGTLVTFKEALCGLFAAGVNGITPPVNQAFDAALTNKEMEPGLDALYHKSNPTTWSPLSGSVVVSGAGLGLPGRDGHVFDDENIRRILDGESRIEELPIGIRSQMLEKKVARLNKSEAGATINLIDDLDHTIKLAGQKGTFNLVEEFGVPIERVETLDISTQLAMAAGIEALRDAGIPLVMTYRQTSKGTFLPNRWMLPEALADETGVIFASAFPGLQRMAEEADRYYEFKSLTTQLEELRKLQSLVTPTQDGLISVLHTQTESLENRLTQIDYSFDRRFIFRILAMGHSQFAEFIGARGPNTHVNAACASTTHAIAVAEDWIRSGRCRRVVIIAGDDVTSGSLASWIGTGLLASGATTTEGDPRQAILPFDRRRNGMIMGMGAAALVIESEDAVRERGMRGICEILATQIANSAYHGTRLDISHVSAVMENLISQAEQRFQLNRNEIAPSLVFVSHETYTPARGGSASAEIYALRKTFGSQANQVVIANTKGYTGHSMGVGVEDVVAVKSLEFNMVPPIANIHNGFQPDPDLGDLNLSHGGRYPIRFALRLGAGFGSQIAMTLMRQIAGVTERTDTAAYKRWLAAISGYNRADLEIVQRTLRIRHTGAPVRTPRPSFWRIGQVPKDWAEAPKSTELSAQPAPRLSDGPVPPEATPQPSLIPASMVSQGEIQAYILQVVSEKTGYPPEMLDPDLDLEADLGIDTVKQAELFANIRTHFAIPRREDLRLAEYNTLARVMQFVKEGLQSGNLTPDLSQPTLAAALPSRVEIRFSPPDAAGGMPATPFPLPDSTQSEDSSTARDPATNPKKITDVEIRDFVLSVVSMKTGYPVEMLDLDLDLEADLGIDTVKQAELFAAVRTHFNIPRSETLRLSEYNNLARVIQFIKDGLSNAAGNVNTLEVKNDPTPSPHELELEPFGTDEIIKAYVLNAVSAKTGYPVEMLDLELDLEADLGIDTVKQAELFASIRTHFAIPRREDLRLSEYNSLAKVIQFVQQGLALVNNADAVVVLPPALAQGMPVNPVPPVESVRVQALLSAAGGKTETQPVENKTQKPIQRRIPVPVLRPHLALCTPTGVYLAPGMRIIIAADQGKVAVSLARRLKSLKIQVLMLHEVNRDEIIASLKSWLAAGPVQGVYFLPALDVEAHLNDLSASAWESGLQQRIHCLYTIMKNLPNEPFLVCATRLGGLFGLVLPYLPAPMGGAVAGFAKALAWERPNSLIKVVDFDEKAPASTISARLFDETLSDPGVVEVGYEDNRRFSIALQDQNVQPDQEHPLNSSTVFLVSGGSGGITSPVILDLAQASHGTFYLAGRTPLPDPADPDLSRLTTDLRGLKKDLADRLTAAGEKGTPAQVDQKLAGLERCAAALATMDEITRCGGTASFHVCDVTDRKAVQQLVDLIIRKEGRVDILIHAAGIERSHRLESKPAAEFSQTISIKAGGLFNLYQALLEKNSLPQSILAFTSVAGRFGNAGQTDYAAANDLVSKMLASIHQLHPATRTHALDWGAWAEVGMASRGHIPALMERAGIETLKPEEAASLVRQELTGDYPGGEVILSGNLGILTGARRPDGGLDITLANQALTQANPVHTMLSRAAGLDLQEGILLEAELDPQIEPFLKDHALNGIPLLPGVMGIEGFSAAARHVVSMLGSGASKYAVSRLENIFFYAPFKFYRNEPRRITWKAQVVREACGLVAYVTLESDLPLRTRRVEHLKHFSGRVHLEPQSEAKPVTLVPPTWNGSYTVNAGDIYRLYFHGPAFQVLEGVQRYGETIVGKLSSHLPPITAGGEQLLSTPMLVELCLQTAGVWEAGVRGILSLPQSIKSLTLYALEVKGNPIYAEVIPSMSQDGRMSFDARVVDDRGHLFLEMNDYHTVPLPYSVEQDLLKPLQGLVE